VISQKSIGSVSGSLITDIFNFFSSINIFFSIFHLIIKYCNTIDKQTCSYNPQSCSWQFLSDTLFLSHRNKIWYQTAENAFFSLHNLKGILINAFNILHLPIAFRILPLQ